MAIRLTPFSDSDREAVLRLWKKALPLDAVSMETLETRVLLDDNFDRQTFLLAKEGAETMGFVLGLVGRRLPLGDADPKGTRAWITAFAVFPDSRLPEIGGMLLAELEDRFRKAGKNDCLVSTYPPGYFTPGIDRKAYPALFNFLQGHGYAVEKEAISMDAPIVLFQVSQKVVELEGRLRDDGIQVREFRREDLLGFLDFLEASMPTDWVRVERANLRKIPDGGFHPYQITVATHGDAIVGYCQFEGSHFGPFGVSDSYQGRGIGTVLLARTLERMREHNYHDAWVMWTDDVAAKVYEKFGFQPTRRFSVLRKNL